MTTLGSKWSRNGSKWALKTTTEKNTKPPTRGNAAAGAGVNGSKWAPKTGKKKAHKAAGAGVNGSKWTHTKQKKDKAADAGEWLRRRGGKLKKKKNGLAGVG